MKRTLGWMAAAGFLIAACGGTGEGDYEAEPIGPHPTNDEPVWTCGDVILAFDQLLEFDALPPAAEDQFAVAAQWESLGNVGGWAYLSDQWIVDRRLLDSDPASLLIADGINGGAMACVPIRRTSMRPVAWELTGESVDGSAVVSIEACVDPETVVVDARPTGDQLLVGLFTSVADTGSCVVGGENTMTIEDAEDAEDARIVSSQYWPFEPGDPMRFFVTDRHPPVVNLDAASFESVTCEATGSATEVFVSFSGLPPGISTSIFAAGGPWLEHDEQPHRWLAARVEPVFVDRLVEYGADRELYGLVASEGGYSYFGSQPGQAIDFELRMKAPGGVVETVMCGSAGLSADLPTVSCSISTLGGQPMLRVDDGMSGLGGLEVYRDGVTLDLGLQIGGPVDVTAEAGVPHTYEVAVSDRFAERAPTRTACGSFTVSPPVDDRQALEWARESFALRSAGPYVYATFVDASGGQIDLAMEPDEDLVTYRFVAPDNASAEADPTTIHDRLLQAIDDGSDVSFELDPWAGVPTQWSIDGVEYTMLCVSFDTAPLEFRDITCDPETDLIGRRD